MRFDLGTLIVIALCSLPARSQMIPPDVQVSITCLDAQNGKEQWSSSFARNLRPYRCEVYKGRVVVFLSGIREVFGELNSTMVFLDSRTGKPMAPFDTRNFVYKDDDPQIRRSRLGSQGSVYEERSELLLPNGWVSYGVARLPWWNARSNNVYFFDRRTWDLAWTVTLPEGAYNLSHWRDILVFCKTRDENGKWTSRLYAQPAGSPVPTWEFTLPKDIPDRESETFDAPGPPKIVRAFSYTVGSRSVFAFGNGAVFALEPRSGKVLWRHVVRDEKVKGDSFSYGEVIETEANILLASGSVLARLDESSGGKLSVLRRDLYNGPTPVCVGTGVYCFTER